MVVLPTLVTEPRRRVRVLLAALFALLLPANASASASAASSPRTLSVTIYRAPNRGSGALKLEALGGFALITETRVVHLPAGETRLRFGGVVDGIIPESAIVTGLPQGVIEKNRDAALLSPVALVHAARGNRVTLVRTDSRSGKATRTPATIRSADAEGVVFETAQGIEALRCSRLPETFQFDRLPVGLVSVPTLSVLTRSPHDLTAVVTLSYLATGFDWAANYTATINPDGKSLNLGAWITLANTNSISLPNAQTQIVAGKLNWTKPEDGDDEAESDAADRIALVEIAHCWPDARERDVALPVVVVMAPKVMAPAPMMMRKALMSQDIVVTGTKVSTEQLGDLKLYRVPQKTRIAARQMKQVRLVDTRNVPFKKIYLWDSWAERDDDNFVPAKLILRTKNDAANKLGLALPSGVASVFQSGNARPLLVAEVPVRDLAKGQEVEWTLGDATDVQVRQTVVSRTALSAQVGGKTRPSRVGQQLANDTQMQVEITNARVTPAYLELRLRMGSGQQVTTADQPLAMKDGRPIFRVTIPAHGTFTMHYVVD